MTTTTDKLPPLPDVQLAEIRNDNVGETVLSETGAAYYGSNWRELRKLYTAEQMHAYARAALAQAEAKPADDRAAEFSKLAEVAKREGAPRTEALMRWAAEKAQAEAKPAPEPVAWLHAATNQAFTSKPPPSLLAQCTPLAAAPAAPAQGAPDLCPSSGLWCAAPAAPAQSVPAYVHRTLSRMLPGAIAMGWISDAERKELEDWAAAPAAPADADSYDSIWHALQKIDTAACAHPLFVVEKDGGIDAVTHNIVSLIHRTAAPAAPAPAPAEPVAWLHPANASCVTTDPTAYARGIPLYAAPAAPAPAEPTPQQIAMLDPWMRPEAARELLTMILAAAPAAPAPAHVVKHSVTRAADGSISKVEAIMSDASAVVVCEAAPAAPAPVPAGFVLVNSGALNMVRNALRRDAEEGKKARGEMLAELDAATVAAPAAPAQSVPAADLYEQLALAHDASLDDDHRACRSILMEVMKQLDKAAPAPVPLTDAELAQGFAMFAAPPEGHAHSAVWFARGVAFAESRHGIGAARKGGA